MTCNHTSQEHREIQGELHPLNYRNTSQNREGPAGPQAEREREKRSY